MESFSLFWLVGVLGLGARGVTSIVGVAGPGVFCIGARGVISIVGVAGLGDGGLGDVLGGGAGDGGGVGVGWVMAVIHFSVVIFLAFLFILAFGFGLGVIALTRSLVAFVVVPILWLRSGILVDWLIGGLAPFIYAACWSGGFVGSVI